MLVSSNSDLDEDGRDNSANDCGCPNKVNLGDGVPTNMNPVMCISCCFLCDIPYYIPSG